ncbi:MAG TPA: Gfo/Idh/MocA family oxidoreductase [Candidatus Limnocylindria bacterium]|nr:Gfo/Idh/MocA family oxidoreductase [Candidatus Limnocylindria bacterium]
MRRLRVGLVSWAHVHAPALARTLATLPQVEFTGSFDEAGAAHDGRTHATLDGLLRESEAVAIASTNADHRRYTEAAARSGVHVLCEKPLATTVADGRAMVQACRAAGVQLGVALPVRGSPAIVALKDAIDRGTLGRVRAVRATNPGQYPGRWFGDPVEAGGGAVMDHTVHVADALRWLLDDEVARVHAELGSFLHGLPVEDCGLLTLDLAGGAFASIDCSWSRPATYPTWGGVTLHVVGDRGTVDVDVFRQSLTHYDDAAGVTRLLGWGDDLNALMVGGFVDAILERRPVPITGEDGLRSLEVVVAAYRSAALGRPVAIAEVA